MPNTTIRPIIAGTGPAVGRYVRATPPQPGELRIKPTFGSYIQPQQIRDEMAAPDIRRAKGSK